MSPNNNDNEPSTDSSKKVKFFELDDAFEDDGENVVGTKFFGGNTMKEELYIPEEEEMALELGQETVPLFQSSSNPLEVV